MEKLVLAGVFFRSYEISSGQYPLSWLKGGGFSEVFAWELCVVCAFAVFSDQILGCCHCFDPFFMEVHQVVIFFLGWSFYDSGASVEHDFVGCEVSVPCYDGR